MNAEHQNKRVRRTHSILEKQRRCEQRVLFDRLQSLLKLDHRSSRLHVLEVVSSGILRLDPRNCTLLKMIVKIVCLRPQILLSGL